MAGVAAEIVTRSLKKYLPGPDPGTFEFAAKTVRSIVEGM
jgi:hypothetical protein